MMLMANSLTHVRPLTCAAAAVYPSRLVAQPPDLIKWVKTEGGFVHKSIKVAQGDTFGLGLVASEDIPKGSDLIALPQHIPLKFDGSTSESENSHSALIKLAQHVPGKGFSFFFMPLFHYLDFALFKFSFHWV